MPVRVRFGSVANRRIRAPCGVAADYVIHRVVRLDHRQRGNAGVNTAGGSFAHNLRVDVDADGGCSGGFLAELR